MAEGKWYDGTLGESNFVGKRALRLLGQIVYNLDDGFYLAKVYPPDGELAEELARSVTEAEAKAAVEEYWVDKEPSG